MPDNVQSLVQYWEAVPLSVAVVPATAQLVLGSDPLRWCVYFQSPAMLIPPVDLIPLTPSSGIRFDLSSFFSSPLRLDQRDHGILVPGEWYLTSGGAFTLSILSLRWKG